MMMTEKVEDMAARVIEKFDLDSSSEHGSETTSQECKTIFGTALPITGVATEEVFAAVKEVVMASGGSSAQITGDALALVAVTSHSMAAQLTLQPPNALSKTISRIYSDSSIWTSRLFKYRSSNAFFHEDSREGLVRVARMLMHAKYPDYKTKGYEAILSRPPVIYASSASRIGIGQYICAQLGLPSTCLTIVPTRSLTVVEEKDKTVDQSVDLTCFEDEIKKDEAGDRTPLFALAHAGTPGLGHVDDLASCLEMCRKYGVWLHVEGNCLASLPLTSSSNVTVESFADSVTLSLSTWLRIPALPNVTLYRPLDAKVVQASGLNSVNMLLKLACLPLWTTLANAGSDGISERLCVPFKFMLELVMRLKDMPRVSILTPKTIGKDFTADLKSILSRPLGVQSLFSKLIPTVIFKYVPDQVEGDPGHSDVYCDNFNSWLAQILKKDYGVAHNLLIDVLHTDEVGVALQFMPFDYAHWFGEKAAKYSIHGDEIPACVERFCDHLQQQLLVLDATVGHRNKFMSVVRASPRFQVVDVKGWAGLGAVRYIPKRFLTSGKAVAATEAEDEIIEVEAEEPVKRKMNDLTDAEKQEIEKLNIELVVHLRGTDPAFSKGSGEDGLVCVRFGMVMEGADVDELVDVVLHTAEDIEDSSQFVESMADVVRQGIVAAENALKKENDEKIWQDGILRYVPLVGSVYNWISPPPKESGIKGRTFHLDAGVIESTENIYKYHMQLNLGEKVKSGIAEPFKERKTSIAEQFEVKPSPEPENASEAQEH